jgi:hypothetical protein
MRNQRRRCRPGDCIFGKMVAMMQETTLSALAEKQLAEHSQEIRALGKRAIRDIIKIGKRLTEAKGIAGHGNWLPWLEREFGLERTHSSQLHAGTRAILEIGKVCRFDH